jgi:hypothetical protein
MPKMLDIIRTASKINMEIKSGEIFGKYCLSNSSRKKYRTKIISIIERKKTACGYSTTLSPKGPKIRGVRSVVASPILVAFNKMFLRISIFISLD